MLSNKKTVVLKSRKNPIPGFMKRNTWFLFLTGLILAACGGRKDQSMQKKIAVITSTNVAIGDFMTFKDYPTSIEGIINSEARAKISGYISEVYVDEGEKVSKGELLFRIETESLTKEAEAAKAQVDAAQIQVDQLIPLVEQQVISGSQLETAKANLKQAESKYASVLANIEYANVRSPVDGYVGEIRIRKGNLVSPADPKPLTTVSDISKVYAYFSMNEKTYLNFLKSAEGKTMQERIAHLPEITLIMANGDEYPLKGTIQTINSQVDKTTGTISFRAIFDNPDRLLTNGSTGIIKIPNQYKNVLAVPRKSTYEQQGIVYVFKVEKNDTATLAINKIIQVLDKTESLYLVKSGVEAGEEIVADGLKKIRPGMPIQTTLLPFDSVAKPLPILFR